jgi:hypothetical protein
MIMIARSTPLAAKIALGCALLCPAAFSWQSPGQPAKLVIQSVPTGANITVNGKGVGQTDATFVVSPGTYEVSVASTDGKLRCEKKVTPAFGQTFTLTCTASGWK